MRKLLFVVVIIVAGYLLFQDIFKPNLESLYDEPYVLVYGKRTCGWCQKMQRELDKNDIPFTFMDLKLKESNDELHPRMETSGMNTRRYDIPVIDVNGELFIRPDIETVIEKYYQ